MERIIFEKKVELLNDPADQELKRILSDYIGGLLPLDQLSRGLESTFIGLFARLCQEEGVQRVSSQEDEMGLKDRLPDTVANWLTVLSEIFSSDQRQRIVDPLDTAAILLLKLYEWAAWNYEARYLYGPTMENQALKGFQGLENEMDLLGNKDDILAQVLEGLSGFCSNYWIDQKSLLPGVRCYFLTINFDYGRGIKKLRLGLRSVLFDQVKFRALCPDQHILAHILESLLPYSWTGDHGPGDYS